jgi:uncharacterized protein involved in exopolysaccharide biosynthesis
MSEETTTAVEPWTARDLWRDYWRVPVIGLLAALIAFGGSFLVPPTYASSTRILIRAKDSTVLNSTGKALGTQPGVVDSQLAGALSDTQGALLSNRAVAERVVDRLKLDKLKNSSSGIVGAGQRAFVAVYKRTRAIVTHGFYREAPKRTAKIDSVQGGLGSKQVEDGYAMDVVATWDDPEIAADIANTAADVLVEMSNQRFRVEADKYRDFLKTQTDGALKAEQVSRSALATYKAQHGITTTPEEDARLIIENQDELNSQIRATQSELEAARAQVNSLSRELANTSQSVTSNQEITTGRSRTQIGSNGQNPVYAQLLSQRQAAEANVASLSARLGALQGALETADKAAGDGLSAEEAELSRLQLDVQIASDTRAQLASELEIASVNAQRSAVEVTRVDEASAPTYPISPKRYLYLAIGLLVGCLVGFVWSFLRVQRRQRLLGLDDDDDADDIELMPEVDLAAAQQVEMGTSAGNGVQATTRDPSGSD